MAITKENANSTSDPGSVTSLTFPLTITNATQLWVVTGSGAGSLSARTVTSVTYAGSALTNKAIADDGTFEHCELWVHTNPATGSNNIVVQYNGGAAMEVAAGAVGLVGASGTFSAAVTTAMTSTVPTISISANANDYVIGGIASDDNTSITENGVLIWEQQAIQGDSCYGAQSSTMSANATAKLTWTQGNNLAAMAAISITASTAGGGGLVPPFLYGDLTGLGVSGRFFKDRL